jgi:hypothetical protein
MLRRTAILGTLLAAFMGLTSVGALASTQANGSGGDSRYCTAEGGFVLVYTASTAADVAGNNNGLTCVKYLPTPDNASAQFVALDDRARASI